MRELLNVVRWIELLGGAPRDLALLAVALGASMLVLGLRFWRIYLALAVASGGWISGVSLATLMGVSRWYVAPVLALLSGTLGFLSAPIAMPLLVGACAGVVVASVVGPDLDATTAWFVTGGGFLTGAALSLLFRRFALALFFGGVGTVLVVGGLKPALGSPGGGVGELLDNRVAWAIGATALLVFAMIAQPAIEPEAED